MCDWRGVIKQVCGAVNEKGKGKRKRTFDDASG